MRVLVIGHSGQDGKLLVEDLRNADHSIFGFSGKSYFSSEEIKLSVQPKLEDIESLKYLLKVFKPDQIYYLAAYNKSAEEKDLEDIQEDFLKYQLVNSTGLLNVLVAMKEELPKTRLFYASSSLIYSGEGDVPLDESSPMIPNGFYGITKAEGVWIAEYFRKVYGLFVSVGILFNHESGYRKESFLTQKIIRGAIRIASGSNEKLILGDLDARVDWSYAFDFIEAFQKILSCNEPDTYIVASGESHSVAEFAEQTFAFFNLNASDYLLENKQLLNRKSTLRVGNPSKLITKTGWKRSIDFKTFVQQLIKDTLVELERKQT
ncbi:NAD-dependent epimerase/dehydratase family protein [Leptospira kanakyensis]|uniref:GDP-mannose 4,6-dehydratase n=1 Tax=Leptospira kanakyensis TaxID=2484968 RepID=A0A6N4QGA2_9LEPT|nr:GDP-mannose 4,6-dehydratase [Leptospira kanakyensis]TGK51927.1 NAD-dependent epimerase/dehydratase family protein [Leptospira kanakyensis]TGK57165.1 NAD-dependent epimerase/dehydratase family protein [Leptospira kanakyensis]TGK71819.1 NAD-dependent epimerase/dehydratase family protein [Leptospira kanakyensis]